MNASIALENQLSLMQRHESSDRPGRGNNAVWAITHKLLTTGDTYYLAGDIDDLIISAGGQPDILTLVLTDDLIPSPAGFCWTADECYVESPFGDAKSEAVHSFGWTIISGQGPATDEGMNVRLHGMTDELIEQSTDTEREFWMVAFSRVDEDPALTGCGALSWRFGETLGAACKRASHQPDTVWLRKMASLFAFIRQRIIVPIGSRPDRATRRRLGIRCEAEPIIQIIKLRRPAYLRRHHDAEEQAVAWQCRWLVSGHWRQHWYPKLEIHQPLWIAPHVKGPEDKPVRTPKKLFAVVQ